MAKRNEPQRKPFKDWFDGQAADSMAAQIASAMPSFNRAMFVKLATRRLSALEFAARVNQFADALAQTLPADVPKALVVLSESLPAPLPDCESTTDGWLQWPVGQYIADHGLPHFEEAMQAMILLTQRFTAEYAVRPFVEARPEETFARLLTLTQDPSPHVRRWCSEGVRPRLPWGRKLHALVKDPTPIWPILEVLKDDDERYVRRSVANNLNDIAKDHRGAVTDRCRQWLETGPQKRASIVNHALRSLIKAGDREALDVIGLKAPAAITARLDVTPRRISVGEKVEMTAVVETTHNRPQQLLIDYAVHYVRTGGKSSAKVFKWTTLELPAKGAVSLDKRHSMKATTIRALYPGEHRVELQVNGVRVADACFTLS